MASGQHSRRRGRFWLNSSTGQIDIPVQCRLPARHLPVYEGGMFGVPHVPAEADDGSIRQAVAYGSMELPIISWLDVRQVRTLHGKVEPSRIVDRWRAV